MVVYSSGDLNPIGYTILIFNQTKIVESRHLGQYSLLVAEPLSGKVSNNLVLWNQP